MSRTGIIAIVAVTLLLGLGGGLTKVGAWYRALSKPSWNPPSWLFGPAWTAILGLAGWGGVMAWNGAHSAFDHTRLLIAIGVNMVFHAAWSPLFFMARRPDWSLIKSSFLWFSCVALMFVYGQFSDAARWTMVPYVLWVTFATFLNWKIVELNKPFGAGDARGAA